MAAPWEFGGNYFRMTHVRRLYSCRADGNITRPPKEKILRGARTPNKSIKVGCKARYQIYQFEVLDRRYSHLCSDLLKREEEPVYEIWYGIYFDPVHNHEFCGYQQFTLDAVKKIIVDNSIKCATTWRLRATVEKEVIDLLDHHNYPVNKNNRMWFPTIDDMRNVVAASNNRALETERMDEIVQLLNDRGDNIHYDFRPDTYNQDNTEFLVVYQNKEMAKILKEHGTTLFLDATHKTNRYMMPLFLLMCYTPHGYQVVAFFISQSKDAPAIAKALEIVKQWNPDVTPKYCMTDIDQAEINALKEVYPEIKNFYCDFHVKKAWDDWLHSRSFELAPESTLFEMEPEKYTIVEARRDAYAMLRRLMYPDTQRYHVTEAQMTEDFNVRMFGVLNSHLALASPRLRNYILHYARSKEHWVMDWRRNENMRGINTNNGVESTNNVLKNRVMCGKGGTNSLPILMTALIYDFIPARLDAYKNKKKADSSTYKRITGGVYPAWFNGIPTVNMKRVKDSYDRSKHFMAHSVVVHEDHYIIRSKDLAGNLHGYKVFVDKDNVLCQCTDFKSYNELPCKHILAVMRIHSIRWDTLPIDFRSNPHLTVDEVSQNMTPASVEPMTSDPEPVRDRDPVRDPEPVSDPQTAGETVTVQPANPMDRAVSILSEFRSRMWDVDDSKQAELLRVMERFKTEYFPRIDALRTSNALVPAATTTRSGSGSAASAASAASASTSAASIGDLGNHDRARGKQKKSRQMRPIDLRHGLPKQKPKKRRVFPQTVADDSADDSHDSDFV